MIQYKFFNEWDQATKHLPRLPLLDTIVTHGCTMQCYGCSSYSDYNMSGGNISWQEMTHHLDRLFERVRIDTFSMLGGEPFLHKNFEEWVRGFRERYPYVMLMIVTNGQLISKNPWILDCMDEYGMIFLKISDHIPGATFFKEAFDMLLDRFDWQKENDCIYQYKEKSLTLAYTKSDMFRKTYKGEYVTMKPYNSDPDQAFEVCDQKHCPLFYQGHLYKCNSIGMLANVLRDHGHLQDPDWQPFVNSGIDIHTCSDKDVAEFVDNYGKVHDNLCRMCPTHVDLPYFSHYEKVISKIPIERIKND